MNVNVKVNIDSNGLLVYFKVSSVISLKTKKKPVKKTSILKKNETN